jgi:hypothetical protein
LVSFNSGDFMALPETKTELGALSERLLTRFQTVLSFRHMRTIMAYKVFTGAPGSEKVSPLEKDRWLFKEFSDLDEALAWAQGVKQRGAVPLLIEGDDGTRMSKYEIADALQVREREISKP